MQMMEMMQSSQMMQMAQMMQMMQGMRMMQGMQGGGMPHGIPGPMGVLGSGDIEQVITGYKTALAITDAQLPQWNAFADALRAGAKLIQPARNAASGTAVPEQLQQRAALLEAEAAAMKQSVASATALYDVLSPKQRHAADLLVADHLARM
jgi:hypothetical protein